MARSILASLFLLHGAIGDRVSNAVACIIALISTRSLLAVVTVTVAFALLREATDGESRQGAVLSETLLPKSGVKFALFVQMWPKIDGLDPRFMQQSIKLHKTRFSSPAVLTDELGAVSCRSTQQ